MPPPPAAPKTKPVPMVPPKGKGKPPSPAPMLVLTVEVIEVLTGESIPGATVEVQGQFKQPTGKNGKVTTHPIPAGTYNILVFKDKFGPVPAKKGDPFTPSVNVILNNQTFPAGNQSLQVQMCDGTGSLLVKCKRTVNNALVALPKADVEVPGKPKTTTPDDGEKFFNRVAAGKITVKAGKVGYGPQRKSNADPFAFGSGTKDVTVPAGFPEEVELLFENPGNTVTKVEATIKDTAGLVAAPAVAGEAAAPAGSQRLRSSVSNDPALGTNKPIVLIRGCNKVTLTATTNPAGKGVGWEVKPNENKSGAPAITPSADAKSATLSTDKTGSFAVTAADGESRIVWNVVFVHVKVDPKSTVFTARKNTYVDNASTAGSTNVSSGAFTAGAAAFEAKVNLELVGGGADGKLGTGLVDIQFHQNGVTDTANGAYVGPPAAVGGANVTGNVTETPPNIPILDATGPGGGQPVPPNAPLITDPGGNTPPIGWSGVFSLTGGPQKFVFNMLDSPGVGFARQHTGGKAASLRSIGGVNGFRSAVAATSQDACNNFVVVADYRWAADFSGNVNYPGGTPAAPALVPAGAVGTWAITGTGGSSVTGGGAEVTLISDATGGQDAAAAGFRITGPRFNSAAAQVMVAT